MDDAAVAAQDAAIEVDDVAGAAGLQTGGDFAGAVMAVNDGDGAAVVRAGHQKPEPIGKGGGAFNRRRSF